jgi:arylsulfatase A-like enzyme
VHVSRARRRGASGWRAAWLAALALAGCGGSGPPERIVLVVIDTLRRDAVGAYGGSLPTPELDALARDGVAVPGVTSAYHQTTSSMAALFTGRTPSLETADPARPLPWTGETWCGLARFAAPGASCIPESLPTLPERLHGAGYWTIGVISNELLHAPAGFHRGFDDLVEVGARLDPDTLPWQARAWRRVHAAATAAIDRRLHDRFFLYVHYMDVHDYPDRKDDYAVGVLAADAAVGALLGHLEQRGLRDGAVLIVTADHGEHLGERHPPNPQRPRRMHYGNPSFEELLAIPLLVAPASALGPHPPRSTTELHDWILRLAGVHPDPPERDVLAPDEVFVSEELFRTYRSDGWKSSFDRRRERALLFDLGSDPREQHNLATARPDVLEAHRRRVDELTRALAAQGARRTEISPEERARLEALGYLPRAPESP